jgi:hypothetical protein
MLVNGVHHRATLVSERTQKGEDALDTSPDNIAL